MSKKIILIFSIVLIVAIIVGILSMQIGEKNKKNNSFKEYKNKEFEYDKKIVAEENIDMDYVYKNGVKVKIDSVVLLDDYIDMKVNFKFDDNIEVSESFYFGYVIYDENNRIYNFKSGINQDKTINDFYDEMEIDYDPENVFENIYYSSSRGPNTSLQDRNIISEIELTSDIEVPACKKLFIKIFDLGFLPSDIDKNEDKYKINEQDSFNISNAEWVFEIDIPESLNNKENLALEKNINGLKINKMYFSRQTLVINGEMEGFNDWENYINNRLNMDLYQENKNKKIYITDNDGNIYYSKDLVELIENDDTFKCRFEINTEDFESKSFYLYVSIDGKTYNCKIIKE